MHEKLQDFRVNNGVFLIKAGSSSSRAAIPGAQRQVQFNNGWSNSIAAFQFNNGNSNLPAAFQTNNGTEQNQQRQFQFDNGSDFIFRFLE